jgi:hypothetical protein
MKPLSFLIFLLAALPLLAQRDSTGKKHSTGQKTTIERKDSNRTSTTKASQSSSTKQSTAQRQENQPIIDFFKDSQLWRDLLTGSVGAFLGFLGAYLIFIKGLKSDKRREEDRLRAEKLDRLKYLSSLVASIIKIGETQAANFEEFASDIKTDPYKRRLLKSVTNNDLKRGSEKLDFEANYLAYISQFDSNKESVKDFKEIISSFDYIDAIYDDAIKVLEAKLQIVYNKKTHFASKFNESLNLAGNTLFLDGYKDDESLTSFINQILTDYYTNREIVEDFETPMKKFIEPLHKFLTENNYLHYPYLNQLFFQLKECMITYNSILLQGNDIAKTSQEFSKQMKDATNDLKLASKKLTETIESQP